ncbi:unnamed protein product [Ostreobium quekettii]|uniref:Uncharacterized protein n=1 Tax=Ostreobium quekettii TaxID=121088 RepID=A0A8S1IRA8_9CHLO|nr:unnamed protein product [Ostreobium quekettii]
MDVARHVVVNEGGALGLLRGISPTLLREIPGNAVMFGVYELLKTLMAKSQGLPDTSGLGTLSLGTAGAVGGAAFWLVMYPADVIKSKIQIDNVHRPIYKGIVDCAIKVHASEGMAGLYRGFAPCIARSFPANAASFLVYELVSGFLNGRSKY